jgi:SH3-like domain-containing protein
MVMAAGGAGLVQAITPTDQSTADVPSREPRSQGKAVPDGKTAPDGKMGEHAHARPVKHSERADAHKGQEQHGKAPAGKASTDAVPGAKATVAPRGEQKGHGAAPGVVTPAPVPKPTTEPPAKETGEPPAKIPRFASLKTDDTNMRKGPGQRYPIEWVYKRRDLPMEVEREYDVWRYVRDQDGVAGWVHQVTLSDRRTFILQRKDATLRADPKDTAAAVATIKVGVIGRLRECAAGSAWCQVQVGGYKGYLRRDQFWGLLPDEVLPSS